MMDFWTAEVSYVGDQSFPLCSAKAERWNFGWHQQYTYFSCHGYHGNPLYQVTKHNVTSVSELDSRDQKWITDKNLLENS